VDNNLFMPHLQSMAPGLAPGYPMGVQPAPLQTLMPPGQLPGFVTQDQVRGLIDQRIKELMSTPAPAPAATPAPPPPAPAAAPDLSRLLAVLSQVDDLAKRALSADDYKAMYAYMQGGAADFGQMMAGEALFPIVQLIWDTIKENRK